MDPEMHQKVVELLEVTKENNQILRSLRRIQRWSTFFRFLYWIVIVGVAVGAFYFLQPYVEQIKSVSASFPYSENIQSFFGQSKAN